MLRQKLSRISKAYWINSQMDNKLLYHLEDSISLGYQHIAKIEEEYRNPPNNGLTALLGKWYRIIKEWEDQVKRGLPNDSRKLSFSTAKTIDPTFEVGKSADIQNLIKSIRARIKVLEDYRDKMQQPSFVLSGPQSRAYIHATDNSTNIIADNFMAVTNQLEAEFEQNYHGADKEQLLKLIGTLKDKEVDHKRKREILGNILTRGAELAQIGSLVAQLLGMLVK